MGRCMDWSSWTCIGIRGDPTKYRRKLNSLYLPAMIGEDHLSEVWAFIHVAMFCHRTATLFPILVNMSSGIGTSSTVSSPSSRSKFGHIFRMKLACLFFCCALECISTLPVSSLELKYEPGWYIWRRRDQNRGLFVKSNTMTYWTPGRLLMFLGFCVDVITYWNWSHHTIIRLHSYKYNKKIFISFICTSFLNF